MNKVIADKYTFAGKTRIYVHSQDEYADNYYNIMRANRVPAKKITMAYKTRIYVDTGVVSSSSTIFLTGYVYLDVIWSAPDYLLGIKYKIGEVFKWIRE